MWRTLVALMADTASSIIPILSNLWLQSSTSRLLLLLLFLPPPSSGGSEEAEEDEEGAIQFK
jgi:hypothetical protein